MFEIIQWQDSNFLIVDEEDNYLHTDGSIYHKCGEYWPTCELAQVVLDKYQPKHVWVHGDVFESSDGWTMIYHKFIYVPPQVMCIVGLCNGPSLRMEEDLKDATFLFNIKDKL